MALFVEVMPKVMSEELHVVTGAFGYSGRWIAHHLLENGFRVRTLTNAVGRDDPFDGQVDVLADADDSLVGPSIRSDACARSGRRVGRIGNDTRQQRVTHALSGEL